MSSDPKSFHLSNEVHSYLVEHGGEPDSIGRALISATRELGNISMMQISPEQGAFMSLLAATMGAHRAIEIGTFTGFSALCLARGMGEKSQLICCDHNEEWTGIARRFWAEAGITDRIDLRIGPALETLRAIEDDQSFDLAFVDADKTGYRDYCQELLRLVRTGGLILVDNVLWFGTVADPNNRDELTLEIRKFNDWVQAHPRFENVMLPIGDGLTIIRVL